MDLPGSGLFYALAALSMAFVSFTSIVVVLHQGTGKRFSALHAFYTQEFCEMGLMAAAFAMLAPVLGIWGMTEELVWRISSSIILALLVPWLSCVPKRRKISAPNERMPLRFYIFIILGIAVIIALCLNIIGLQLKPGPGPIAIAAVYMLSMASVIFIRTYSLFLRI
jgi:hydrogenase-4 membrane subunit HyfE